MIIDCDCHFREHYHDDEGRIVFLPPQDSSSIKKALRFREEQKKNRKSRVAIKRGDDIDYKWGRLDSKRNRRGNRGR